MTPRPHPADIAANDKDRHIQRYDAEWRGIAVSVAYEAAWLQTEPVRDGFTTAHLQVESVRPERAPLPITETGYRSLFLAREEVDEAGGPVAYVLAWLDHAAADPKWQAAELRRGQLSLF